MSKNEANNTEEKQEKTKGRPKAKVDVEVLRRLCEIQCNNKEIAFVLGVSTDTLVRHYKAEMETGRALGKIALRRAQWRNAVEKNNVTMQIWLGKNVLMQSDNNLDSDDTQILPWKD
jgi:hypothetical protein